ncbi:hypothetical protein DVJ77_13500 [Dyella tabacisoli]|uniref:Uncharacterized protein n=1 Tax=Dyella tabacisoli TaxID=2282381 RepID=A0A369UNM6_9GAMM|nr:hypothetical protein DVJ77_13500 [Dyella tabacisoli]
MLLPLFGCSNEQSLGKPEKIGPFTFERFRNSYSSESGPTVYEYYKISYGSYFPSAIHFPNDAWVRIDQITRLPSAQPAWMIRTGNSVAMLTERAGRLALDPLWNVDYDKGQEQVQRVDDKHWYIPDFDRVGEYPNFTYRSGRLFNGVTLTQRWLPVWPVLDGQPGTIAPSRTQFLAISPDETTSAWLFTTFPDDGPDSVRQYEVRVLDERTPTLPPVALDAKFMEHRPLPDSDYYKETRPLYQAWFDAAFRWNRTPDGRWQLSRRY